MENMSNQLFAEPEVETNLPDAHYLVAGYHATLTATLSSDIGGGPGGDTDSDSDF